MSGKDSLSLDEFATAPRRQRPASAHSGHAQNEGTAATRAIPDAVTVVEREKGETASEASKALRQMKRARMKGASHFVNVNLDRETKRRLKLAAFNGETSMQAIVEKAIRQFLDANGH